MTNNILIITDNVLQYEAIKDIFNKSNRTDFEVDYKHSPFQSEISNHPDFIDTNNGINVKENAQKILRKYNLVISVHCKQFFPINLVKGVRYINIHPGYNPINRGWYPQVFAIINDLPIGATIYEMDEKLDNDPVIVREFVNKYEHDTSFSIYQRVLKLEIK